MSSDIRVKRGLKRQKTVKELNGVTSLKLDGVTLSKKLH